MLLCCSRDRSGLLSWWPPGLSSSLSSFSATTDRRGGSGCGPSPSTGTGTLSPPSQCCTRYTGLYWVGAALFAATGGYTASLALMHCPRCVEPEFSSVAGMMGAAAVGTGILAGVTASCLMPTIVSHPAMDWELPGQTTHRAAPSDTVFGFLHLGSHSIATVQCSTVTEPSFTGRERILCAGFWPAFQPE